MVGKKSAKWKHFSNSRITVGDAFTMAASEAWAISDGWREAQARGITRPDKQTNTAPAKQAMKMTVSQAVLAHIERQVALGTHREATTTSWRQWAGQLSKQELGRMLVGDVTKADVQLHFDQRFKTAKGSIRNHIARLNSVFQDLQDKDILVDNPVLFMKRSPLNKVKTKQQAKDIAVVPDLVGVFLNDLEEANLLQSYHSFFACGITMGCRPDTLYRMDIDHISFAKDDKSGVL